MRDILVFAGNHTQYIHLVDKLKLKRSECLYVLNHLDAKGRRPKRIIITCGFPQRSDSLNLLEQIEILEKTSNITREYISCHNEEDTHVH